MDVDSKDETKSIVALGILAGILVYIQIKTSGGGVFPYQPIVLNSVFYSLFQVFILIELILFGAYVLFFTLALGVDSWKEGQIWGKYLKGFADIWFGLGAFWLVPIGIDTFVLFLQEVSGAQPFNNAGTYSVAISIAAIVAILAFVRLKAMRYPELSPGT